MLRLVFPFDTEPLWAGTDWIINIVFTWESGWLWPCKARFSLCFWHVVANFRCRKGLSSQLQTDATCTGDWAPQSTVAIRLRLKIPDPKVVRRGEEWARSHPRLTYNTPVRSAKDPMWHGWISLSFHSFLGLMYRCGCFPFGAAHGVSRSRASFVFGHEQAIWEGTHASACWTV